MSPADLVAHPLCQAATLALLHFVWQGVLIAAILAAVVELLGSRRPQARYACSLAALCLMMACPVVTMAWQLPWGRRTGVGGEETELLATLSSIATEPARTSTSFIAAAGPYVLAAWLVGVTFFGCRLLLGLIGVRQLRRGRLPLEKELSDRVEQLGRRLGMRTASMVFLSRSIGEAMAVGLVKPIVLIPAVWATEMPLAMLEAVIAHELAHLRRQDLWVNLLQRIAETLLFYHPAVWWLSRRLRAERELCCDELAVAATGRRLEYVQALETVARQATRVEPLLAAGIRGDKHMQLLHRVRNVLGLSAAADRSRLWPAGLVALLLPLAAWGWSAGLIAPQVSSVVADERADDREDDDDDEDDEDGEKEGRKGGDRDDDDDREGRKDRDRERDDDDDRLRDGKRKENGKERDDDDDAAREPGKRDEDNRFFSREIELRRDGVKEPGAKDGEARKEDSRDGEPRRVIRKDGKRMQIELKYDEENDRVAELMVMVKKLTAENERLQAELFKLRGGKKEGPVPEKLDPARKEEAAARKDVYKRAVAAKEELFLRAKKMNEADRDLREAAERKEIEIRERKIKAAAKEDGDRREKQEDAARFERDQIERKIDAAERELKKRERDDNNKQ